MGYYKRFLMAQYLVRAGTSEGRVICKSRPPKEEAGRLIEKDGLIPGHRGPHTGAASMACPFSGQACVKSGDLLVFNQGLVTLLKAVFRS